MNSKHYKAVLNFATKAHQGQLRKYTHDPYIVHPIRVATMVKSNGGSEAMILAALLHDVLEDTKVTQSELHTFLLERLPKKLANKTIDLVVDLTDVYTTEAFPSKNRAERTKLEAHRLGKAHKDAQTVKYCDIIDNLSSILKYDKGFGLKFVDEKHYLLMFMNKGDKKLFSKAVELTA
jgi:guanosine-3',5'-bis(diphosphate) 3'-pyrophosphohydrolase